MAEDQARTSHDFSSHPGDRVDDATAARAPAVEKCENMRVGRHLDYLESVRLYRCIPGVDGDFVSKRVGRRNRDRVCCSLSSYLPGWAGPATLTPAHSLTRTGASARPTIRGRTNRCGGVRQASNTWFNLYAVATSPLVAIQVLPTGAAISALFLAPGVISDAYVFVVLFLGLGSMWFHGSLTEWGGNVDAVSMYLFTGFLVAFAAYRLRPTLTLFWLLWVAAVGAASILHAVLNRPGTSVVLIAAQVTVYVALEFLVWRRSLRRLMPLIGLGGMLVVGGLGINWHLNRFWLLSQTGGRLCDPYESGSRTPSPGTPWPESPLSCWFYGPVVNPPGCLPGSRCRALQPAYERDLGRSGIDGSSRHRQLRCSNATEPGTGAGSTHWLDYRFAAQAPVRGLGCLRSGFA